MGIGFPQHQSGNELPLIAATDVDRTSLGHRTLEPAQQKTVPFVISLITEMESS
jgi:hypothetical protein